MENFLDTIEQKRESYDEDQKKQKESNLDFKEVPIVEDVKTDS